MEFVTKKQITKEIYFLRLIAPAAIASVSSPLGPLLGQYGINIMDFCSQFNNRTWFIAEGLPLIVDLVFNKPKKEFFFEIRGPLTSALLFECVDHSNKKLRVHDIYKCCLMKTQNSNVHFNLCKNWVGSFKSYGLNNYLIF